MIRTAEGPSISASADAATDEQAIRFLHELVATPSVHPNEAAASHLFAQTAVDLGLTAHVDEAGNGIALAAPNADALRRGGSLDDAERVRAPEIVLLGHIDTVSGDVPVRLEDGVLHGRGSVDAKGPLAAMLFAAARARPSVPVSIRVVAATGEETAVSPGARHIAPALRPDACIIGEPSGWDGVTLGYKGRLLVRLTLELPSGHSAGPEASPTDAAVQWWNAALRRVERLNTEHTTVFTQIQASLRSIHTESDGLYDRCTLTAGFRLPTWMPPQTLEAAMRNLETEASITASLEFSGHESAHESPRNDPVARAIGASIRHEGARPRPKRKTGTSDMNVVAPVWDCPIAAYGPGDSALDHTPHEHLHIDEYLRSIRILTRAIESLAEELASRDNQPTE